MIIFQYPLVSNFDAPSIMLEKLTTFKPNSIYTIKGSNDPEYIELEDSHYYITTYKKNRLCLSR